MTKPCAIYSSVIQRKPVPRPILYYKRILQLVGQVRMLHWGPIANAILRTDQYSESVATTFSTPGRTLPLASRAYPCDQRQQEMGVGGFLASPFSHTKRKFLAAIATRIRSPGSPPVAEGKAVISHCITDDRGKHLGLTETILESDEHCEGRFSPKEKWHSFVK